MSLNSYHTVYPHGSYQKELYYLLKTAENDALQKHPNNPTYLQVTTDKAAYQSGVPLNTGNAVIGYGYDLVVNKNELDRGRFHVYIDEEPSPCL